MKDSWEAIKVKVTKDYISLMLEYYGDNPDADSEEREPFQVSLDELKGGNMTTTFLNIYQRLEAHINFWCEANKNIIMEVWEEFRLGEKWNALSIGHDLFFTSKGEGSGFWDGDWERYGDNLTAAAEKFPDLDFYVGDDGEIYETPQLEIPVEKQ